MEKFQTLKKIINYSGLVGKGLALANYKFKKGEFDREEFEFTKESFFPIYGVGVSTESTICGIGGAIAFQHPLGVLVAGLPLVGRTVHTIYTKRKYLGRFETDEREFIKTLSEI